MEQCQSRPLTGDDVDDDDDDQILNGPRSELDQIFLRHQH